MKSNLTIEISEKRKFLKMKLTPQLNAYDIDQDTADDRRLSDLLPSEFISQIGLNPDDFVFSRTARHNYPRRMTDPIVYYSPQNLPLLRRQPIEPSNCYVPHSFNGLDQEQFLVNPIQSGFIVQVQDASLYGFLLTEKPFLTDIVGNKVIVKDGSYLRIGYIKSRLNENNKTDFNVQILSTFIDPALDEYLSQLQNIAQCIIPTLLIKYSINTQIESIELVSYLGRNLMRIKLHDPSIQNISFLIEQLIFLFQIAVEIY